MDYALTVRSCLCMVLGLVVGSCSVGSIGGKTSAEQPHLSPATILVHSRVEELGYIMNAVSPGLIRRISYPEIYWPVSSDLQLVAIELLVHDRHELDQIIERLEGEGSIIKAVRYDQTDQ